MKTPAPKPSEVLTAPEMDAVVGVLMYHMPMETRRVLMASCPLAYSKLVGGGPEITTALLKLLEQELP